MKQEIRPVLTVRLFREQRCYGPGIDALLRGVQARHSLRAAAQSMGMAYSKAWNTVRRCEEELGFPLLVRAVGGRNGGGAALTPEAASLMAAYDRYTSALQAQANALFLQEFQDLLKE